MSSNRVYDRRSVDRLMKLNGFYLVPGRGKGSHMIYKNGSRTVSFGKSFNRMVVQRLIKENNLVIEEG